MTAPMTRRFLTWQAALDMALSFPHAVIHRVLLPNGPVWEVSWKR